MSKKQEVISFKSGQILHTDGCQLPEAGHRVGQFSIGWFDYPGGIEWFRLQVAAQRTEAAARMQVASRRSHQGNGDSFYSPYPLITQASCVSSKFLWNKVQPVTLPKARHTCNLQPLNSSGCSSQWWRPETGNCYC